MAEAKISKWRSESILDIYNFSFATFLFTHNAQIAIFAFALGFAFAVPTILLILYNGLMLGAFVAVFAAKGLGPNVVAWLTIHGTTEIFAICISGAAGVRIGMAIAFPGRLARMDSAVRAGRIAATAMVGTVIMLAVAGLLEGVGRQTIVNDGTRLLIGLAALILPFLRSTKTRRTPCRPGPAAASNPGGLARKFRLAEGWMTS